MKKTLLIEEPSIPILDNANAYFARLVCQAKGYQPIVMSDNLHHDSRFHKLHLNSFDTYEHSKNPLPLHVLGWIWIVARIKYLSLFLGQSILNLHYAGVKYGDLIYDQYLVDNELGTIHQIDRRVIATIEQCLLRHHTILQALRRSHAAAVLVSQQVSIRMGVVLRVALKYGYEGYLRAGHHESTLQRFTKPDEVYDYEYKPSPVDLKNLLHQAGRNIDKMYQAALKRQIAGFGDKEGLDAYNRDHLFYRSRKLFHKNLGLNPAKANIFVMLHALNDHPRSHFRQMLFQDFYHWMMETLAIAKKNNHVNWIFKQHPSIKYYSALDVDYKKIFTNLPDHIKYMDIDSQIDTRSLGYCADLVVTCLGSAGFEIPALSGVPAITAGDNHYSGLGIAREPRTIQEYTNYLVNLKNRPPKLSRTVIERARGAYIYIYETSRVPVHICPRVSLEEEKTSDQGNWYWRKVMLQKKTYATEISHETGIYISCIKMKSFKRLSFLDLP